MMRLSKYIHFTLAGCIALICTSGCDFPADPPLKSSTPVSPPASYIDTAKYLLPLAKGVSWIYIGVGRNQQTQSYETNANEIVTHNGTYYRVNYLHNPQGSPPRPVQAFPPTMRNIQQGLAFYNIVGILDTSEKRELKPAFVLPYPSKPGQVWTQEPPQQDFTVRVIAKDTTIVDYLGERRSVYRYEVTERGAGVTNFYVLPGKALLRIEHPDATFHTVAWMGLP